MPEQALRVFLDDTLSRFPQVRRLVLGFSGGLDSTVLLFVLRQLQREYGYQLAAVHVHHGLSPNADAWVAHVESVCAAWAIPLCVQRVEVAQTASVEAAARQARRQALAAQMTAGDALLLAQHQNDQAETVLFRLMRGAGVKGLGAMQATSTLTRNDDDAFPLWRPLLSVSRAQLESFAIQQGLSWIEDESNTDTRFSRNFLRQDIVPSLQTHWPSVAPVLAATALRMQEANQLLDELAGELATLCVDEQQRLHISALQKLSPPRQRLVLRYWLQQSGFRLPDEVVLAQILEHMLSARADAAPCVTWQGGEVRRYQDHLYALSPREDDFLEWQAEWDMQAPLRLPDGRWLTVAGGNEDLFRVQVRFRQGGEHLHRHGMTQELKKLLQSQSVPPWERRRLPLLFKDDELVRVVGTALCSAAWPPMITVKIENAAGHAEQ